MKKLLRSKALYQELGIGAAVGLLIVALFYGIYLIFTNWPVDPPNKAPDTILPVVESPSDGVDPSTVPDPTRAPTRTPTENPYRPPVRTGVPQPPATSAKPQPTEVPSTQPTQTQQPPSQDPEPTQSEGGVLPIGPLGPDHDAG